MPHLDDEEAENEEHDADRSVDDAEQDALHEVGRDGVVGGGEDHGAQDLPDADEGAGGEPCDGTVAALDLSGEIAGDKEIHDRIGDDHQQDAKERIERGEQEGGQINHSGSPIVSGLHIISDSLMCEMQGWLYRSPIGRRLHFLNPFGACHDR